MEFHQIVKDINDKNYSPVYLLCGEEEYFIDKISDRIEESVLDESEREFNQTILYGAETDVLTVESEAKRYPMMAPYNVVIIKEAQKLKKIEKLVNYVENPSPTSILVLNYKHKTLDGRLNLSKSIKKKGVFFNSKKLYENQLIPWIEKYVRTKSYSISPKASFMIKESVGDSLIKISNELDKLFLNLKDGESIDEHKIEKYIGLSKDFNVFELTDALGKRDVVKANRISTFFGKNEKTYPLPYIIPAIYRFFTQLLLMHSMKGKSDRELASGVGIHPYFLKDYKLASGNYSIKKIARVIHSLRNADRHSKGIGVAQISNQEILKELIFEILH